MTRLERDGLVRAEGDPDTESRRVYAVTDTGRVELMTWFSAPVSVRERPRDELAIKLAMAVTTPGVEVAQVVQTRRSSTLRALQELTRLKTHADEDTDAAWLLVLESMIFSAEAEGRWLDHCETKVARLAERRRNQDSQEQTEATVADGGAHDTGVRR